MNKICPLAIPERKGNLRGMSKIMRASEGSSGGNPRAFLGQPRRSIFPAESQSGGVWGPARVAHMGGDRGDWTAVRSRKRKATESVIRGQDRVSGSDGRRGEATGRGQAQQSVFDRLSSDRTHDHIGGGEQELGTTIHHARRPSGNFRMARVSVCNY